jgi:hypothetical protein
LSGDFVQRSVLVDDKQYWSVNGWEPTGATCTAGPGDGASVPTDSDGDGTSDSNDADPTNPGVGGTPDPAAEPDPLCGTEGHAACPNDPTATNSSTGGGDCTSPPQSTGDPTLAQIAFQTWATRCALVANANTGEVEQGGTGTDMTATNAKLDGIGAGIDGLLDVSGETLDTTGLGAVGSSVMQTREVDGTFDDSGFGWSRTCPAPVTVVVMGNEVTLQTSALCNWLTVGGWFVLLLTGFRCLKIVMEA